MNIGCTILKDAIETRTDSEHFLARVYHEAPDDVFELFLSMCSDMNEDGGGGGLNALRLANKRCKRVVESCTTRLTNLLEEDGPESLPIHVIERCRMIEEIRCLSRNIKSLEGCPDGLKRLIIGDSPHLSNLSPLASCSMMEILDIDDSSITDISAVASMPLLEEFACCKMVEGRPSIEDLSPLAACPRLKRLHVRGNMIKDLSLISSLSALEDLGITDCPLITDLAPLSSLKNLKELRCRGINRETSLLPIVSCAGLRGLRCRPDAVDLMELKRRMPHLLIWVF
jgi:Leucine-rich repeat (LRR) protein